MAIIARSYSQWGLGDFEATTSGLDAAIPVLKSLAMQSDLRRALNGMGVTLTALGRFSEAINAFKRSIEIAKLLGDDMALSVTWSNLGSLYTDLGWFDEAAVSLRTAMSVDTTPQIRLGAELYANAMWLAIHLGSLDEAEASKSGLWRHRALALLCRADLLLARASPELAWPLVERAVKLVGNKARFLHDVGQFHRLALHFDWSTQGMAGVEAWLNPAREGNYKRVTDWLEIKAMFAWIALEQDDHREDELKAVLRELETKELVGLISRLIAVRCSPISLSQTFKDEPPAAVVARLYPSPQRHCIPRSVLGHERTARQPRFA